MMDDSNLLVGTEQIREYWESSIPWSFTDEPETTFAQIREMRYAYQNYMHDAIPFTEMNGKAVVEVGAGAGVDAIEFARYGADVVAVEPTDTGAEATREHAEEAGVDLTVYQTGGEDMPLPDSSVDCVYSFGVLHHIPDIGPVLDEITRVLKPDGRFVAMVYNRDSLLFAYSILYRHGVRDGKLAEHSPSELAALYSERNAGCPFTKLYSESEAVDVFSERFDHVESSIHYDVIDTDDRRKVKVDVPDDCDLGWHIIVDAKTPRKT